MAFPRTHPLTQGTVGYTPTYTWYSRVHTHLHRTSGVHTHLHRVQWRTHPPHRVQWRTHPPHRVQWRTHPPHRVQWRTHPPHRGQWRTHPLIQGAVVYTPTYIRPYSLKRPKSTLVKDCVRIWSAIINCNYIPSWSPSWKKPRIHTQTQIRNSKLFLCEISCTLCERSSESNGNDPVFFKKWNHLCRNDLLQWYCRNGQGSLTFTITWTHFQQ
jgi:hypothetical protein